MIRRYLTGGVLVLAAVVLAAYLGAQFAFSRTAFAKPKAEAKPMPALRAGYVAMAEVMSGSKKWQDRAKKATAVREEAAKKLGVLQASAQQLQQKAQKATGEEQEKLALELREVSRKLEDSDRTLRGAVDKEAEAALVEMQADFAREIEGLARERQLDVVYGHPANFEKMFAAMGKTQQSLQMYFQPTAVQPLYLRAEMDLTKDLIDRLNASYAAATEKAEDD